jgi:hypothetical protein
MTVDQLYDYITAQMTAEQALRKLLQAGLIEYEALKFTDPENAVHPLIIITMAAQDMGWEIAVDPEDEDVNGIAVGTTAYMTKLFNAKGPLKPHEDYDFVDGDKVFVENSDDTVDYFQLSYEQELGEWVLIPFTDKHFNEPKKNDEGKTVAEPMNAYGYELLQRVDDFELEELT